MAFISMCAHLQQCVRLIYIFNETYYSEPPCIPGRNSGKTRPKIIVVVVLLFLLCPRMAMNEIVLLALVFYIFGLIGLGLGVKEYNDRKFDTR